MDLHQLRMFAAVAELGNLTHAAERLHISQPAASAKIKLLEEELRVTLFERKVSGLTPTRVGMALLPTVQQLLATANDVVMQARNFSGQVTGVIKLAVVVTVVDTQIAELINGILSQYPMLDIEFQHTQSSVIKKGVTNGEFDAGLVLGNKDIPDLRRVLLQKLYYRTVASNIWHDRVHNASWKELASLPWISCTGTHFEMVTQLFESFDFKPERIVKANNQQLISNLVMTGAGLGLMPEDQAVEARAAGNIILIKGGRTSTYLQFIYRADREKDPAIQAILRTLREFWPQSDLLQSAMA
jgi:DNA-binding transcriptional LysR family regulator